MKGAVVERQAVPPPATWEELRSGSNGEVLNVYLVTCYY